MFGQARVETERGGKEEKRRNVAKKALMGEVVN